MFIVACGGVLFTCTGWAGNSANCPISGVYVAKNYNKEELKPGSTTWQQILRYVTATSSKLIIKRVECRENDQFSINGTDLLFMTHYGTVQQVRRTEMIPNKWCLPITFAM